MRESLVGVGHAVDILLALEGGTLLLVGSLDLGGQLEGHGLLTALARETDQVLHADALLALGTDLGGDLEGSTTDTAAAHLDARGHVGQGFLPHLKAVLFGTVSDDVDSLVEDLVTGIFLVFEDQFNVGDIIETGGFRGVVESIGIRTTAIRDMGGNIKIVNNSDLRNILNRSSVASFATTTVSVSYSTDLEKAEPMLKDFLPTLKTKYPELFLEDPAYLGVQELGDSGVLLKIGARVNEKDIYKAPRILNREIKVFFDKSGIEIPFPQVVVHNPEK